MLLRTIFSLNTLIFFSGFFNDHVTFKYSVQSVQEKTKNDCDYLINGKCNKAVYCMSPNLDGSVLVTVPVDSNLSDLEVCEKFVWKNTIFDFNKEVVVEDKNKTENTCWVYCVKAIENTLSNVLMDVNCNVNPENFVKLCEAYTVTPI